MKTQMGLRERANELRFTAGVHALVVCPLFVSWAIRERSAKSIVGAALALALTLAMGGKWRRADKVWRSAAAPHS